MKLIKRARKFLLILSVLLCLYAQLILVDSMLCGKMLPYRIPVMGVVFTWLSLMWYANFMYEKM